MGLIRGTSLLLAIALLFAILVPLCLAHSRWTSPASRNTASGIKGPYPCGNSALDGFFAGQTVTDLAPGPVTLSFLDTVYHSGAPYRIALSIDDDSNYDRHLLLDQVPHYSASSPASYTATITIPNINCTRCSLQLISVMTDKLVNTPACCTYPQNPTSVRPPLLSSWLLLSLGSNRSRNCLLQFSLSFLR